MNTGKKLTIGILTGGGDVPGLNPAIRAITVRALREGYRVIGIRKGWEGLINIDRDLPPGGQPFCEVLTEETVNRVGRTGGTFLHTSRTNPSKISTEYLPLHLREIYQDETNDLTEEVLKNIEYLGIDTLIPIGGDDTLSYAVRLHKEGVPIVAIPKTMDNDVPGTDYCIGFSTCITRTIELTHQLRTCAGSHERFLVIEVFGRYAGFTALLPTMAGAANRCIIPEHPFSVDRLAELMCEDRKVNSSHYSVALVSEGAVFCGERVYESGKTDGYGHRKLGGIGDLISERLKDAAPKYNVGRSVGVINQRLAYLVRCGVPDAMDSIAPMAFGNLALNLILQGISGRLVVLRHGQYDDVSLDYIAGRKKLVDIEKFYNPDRLRPRYETFQGMPLFIMTSEED
tara:strand:+ start:998 stop:2197 length:1200 start_codon:yes stop_codon:yes gene_type:complete